MSPLPLYIATSLSTGETAALTAVLVGVIALLVARLIGQTDAITRRAYGKVYSGAPGADTESKPDGR